MPEPLAAGFVPKNLNVWTKTTWRAYRERIFNPARQLSLSLRKSRILARKQRDRSIIL
jgi:hypothetical protein